MPLSRPIFFLSDFGLEDPYVGIVKAVVHGIAPHVSVIDLAHQIPPGNLRRAAYALYQSVEHLPQGSVVLAVVDPGVGSSREALIVQAQKHIYVVPNNGLLSLVPERDPLMRVFQIENPRGHHAGVSRTFHGRDLFAPVAARLALGAEASQFGTEIGLKTTSPYGLSGALAQLPVKLSAGPAGEVLTFDRFGNAITTLRLETRRYRFITAGGRRVAIKTHYAEVPVGSPLAYLGSAGLLEIGVNRGSARELLRLEEGDAVELG